MIHLQNCEPQHLEGILALQRRTHRASVTDEVAAKEGYVLWLHSLEMLRAINQPIPHVIALDEAGIVCAYALSMPPSHRNILPEAIAFFTTIELQRWQGQPIGEYRYTGMGQVAIAPEHRGTGLFRQIYERWYEVQAQLYELAVTEIAPSNLRSLAAHKALGWQEVGRQQDGDQEWIMCARNLL